MKRREAHHSVTPNEGSETEEASPSKDIDFTAKNPSNQAIPLANKRKNVCPAAAHGVETSNLHIITKSKSCLEYGEMSVADHTLAASQVGISMETMGVTHYENQSACAQETQTPTTCKPHNEERSAGVKNNTVSENNGITPGKEVNEGKDTAQPKQKGDSDKSHDVPLYQVQVDNDPTNIKKVSPEEAAISAVQSDHKNSSRVRQQRRLPREIPWSPSPPPSNSESDSDSDESPPSSAAAKTAWWEPERVWYSWDQLMRAPTFSAAPVSCFPHAPLSATWRNITPGMKVEVPVALGSSDYWIATILQVEGYRGLVRLEGMGSDRSRDRWVDLVSREVRQIGWCAARGRPLSPPGCLPPPPAHGWRRALMGRLIDAKTIPAGFRRKVLAGMRSQLREGQVIEVVDKSCVSQVRPARVVAVLARRLHVQYLDAVGDENAGFWCHENSPLVHPAGWAVAVGHNLHAPSDYRRRCFMRRFTPDDATEDYLPAPPPVTHAGFKVGMKLEAVDPLQLSSIGVATVKRLLGNHHMMVRLETYPPDPAAPPGHDWFCYHASSPYIFPAGFCRTVGIELTPPHGHTADTFRWEAYRTGAAAQVAPAELFHRPPLSHGFQRGHRLEAVDLMDPQLVCVATVADVVGRLMRIHFDGWEDRFDQWVDVESTDIFPVGWCRLVGHRLEPPKAPEPRRLSKKRSLQKPLRTNGEPTKKRGRPFRRAQGESRSRTERSSGASSENTTPELKQLRRVRLSRRRGSFGLVGHGERCGAAGDAGASGSQDSTVASDVGTDTVTGDGDCRLTTPKSALVSKAACESSVRGGRAALARAAVKRSFVLTSGTDVDSSELDSCTGDDVSMVSVDDRSSQRQRSKSPSESITSTQSQQPQQRCTSPSGKDIAPKPAYVIESTLEDDGSGVKIKTPLKQPLCQETSVIDSEALNRTDKCEEQESLNNIAEGERRLEPSLTAAEEEQVLAGDPDMADGNGDLEDLVLDKATLLQGQPESSEDNGNKLTQPDVIHDSSNSEHVTGSTNTEEGAKLVADVSSCNAGVTTGKLDSTPESPIEDIS